MGVIEVLPQDIAVYLLGEVLHPLTLGQLAANLGGGDFPQIGNLNHLDPGVIALGQGRTMGMAAVHVLPGAGKSTDSRQLHDALGKMPVLQGEEHVRAHKQPQLILWPPLHRLLQGVHGVALSLPSELHVPDLCLGTQQVRRHCGHGQSLLRGWTADRQLLVRRLTVGH